MTIDELLHELARRGITVVPTVDGHLHYTSPTAAAFTPELREALISAKPTLLARLSAEPAAQVGPTRLRRTGSRPPAGSPTMGNRTPTESPRRPPLDASRPAPTRRRRPAPPAASIRAASPTSVTIVMKAPGEPEPMLAPLLGSVSPGEPESTPSLSSVGPPAPASDRRRGLRRSRTVASVSEPAELGGDQPPPSLVQLLATGALLGTVAIIGLAAWASRGGDGQAATSPAPSPADPWGDGLFPGGWPGY